MVKPPSPEERAWLSNPAQRNWPMPWLYISLFGPWNSPHTLHKPSPDELTHALYYVYIPGILLESVTSSHHMSLLGSWNSPQTLHKPRPEERAWLSNPAQMSWPGPLYYVYIPGILFESVTSSHHMSLLGSWNSPHTLHKPLKAGPSTFSEPNSPVNRKILYLALSNIGQITYVFGYRKCRLKATMGGLGTSCSPVL